ncbi:MAG: tol-pal system protein YbgF [Alphaproteobacteria bacterium]|nr:tol-pal system protein YbgF [Alphaproteobacteria bacterium]MCB9984267.1 tol-pal system protein YbgF [Micavibrio sp.]
MATLLNSNGTFSTFQAAIAACAVLTGSVFLSGTASADDVSNRLSRIERDVETLNQAVYKGKMPPASAMPSTSSGSNEYQANVEVRLSEIESQLRDLTGKIEQQNFENVQLKERLDRALADMDVRLSSQSTESSAQSGAQSGTLGANDMGGPVLTQPPPQPESAAPVDNAIDYDAPASANSPTQNNLGVLTEAPGGASIQSQPGDDPAGQYEMAFSLLKSGNYKASRNGFDEFLKKYPDHPLSPNAMYWLGENYYAEGAYDKAMRVFAESYKKYPKGPKSPDSLLKLGMSLEKTGKTQQACITLQQLKKEFPTGSASVLSMADQEIAKMGCGG